MAHESLARGVWAGPETGRRAGQSSRFGPAGYNCRLAAVIPRMSIVNISAYKFISLDDLPALREQLLARCQALALKGTILLAREGINLFLAGTRGQIDDFIASLHADPRFTDIVPKESLSDGVPFGRMRVRLKREIITMRAPAIRPEGGRAPAVDAPTLRRWLDQGHDDEGREVVLLDTRNDYETAVGKFPQAIDYGLAGFTDFPSAIAADRARYVGKTVVSYCTGGIRCEKAALHMGELGMEHVYQLEGGILKYLEQTDAKHWQGECFVFDGRGAVGTDLRPLPCGERVGVRGRICTGAASEHAVLPLPCGERTGVRGRPGAEPTSEQALIDSPASPTPTPQSSPRRGEEANATSALLGKSLASPSPSPQSSPRGGEEANATSALLHKSPA